MNRGRDERRQPTAILATPEELVEAQIIMQGMVISGLYYTGKRRAKRLADEMAIALERPPESSVPFHITSQRDLRVLRKGVRGAFNSLGVPGAAQHTPNRQVQQELMTKLEKI